MIGPRLCHAEHHSDLRRPALLILKTIMKQAVHDPTNPSSHHPPAFPLPSSQFPTIPVPNRGIAIGAGPIKNQLGGLPMINSTKTTPMLNSQVAGK
ncbi:MAG TPA: hypothetical protein PK402_07280 [Tepidisphaeraceae bacterium]|nr:hypothetical protein [Tepidisphaeraceae bacterium]